MCQLSFARFGAENRGSHMKLVQNMSGDTELLNNTTHCIMYTFQIMITLITYFSSSLGTLHIEWAICYYCI